MYIYNLFLMLYTFSSYIKLEFFSFYSTGFLVLRHMYQSKIYFIYSALQSVSVNNKRLHIYDKESLTI